MSISHRRRDDPTASACSTELVPKRLEALKTLISSIRRVRAVIVWPEELAPGKPRFPTPPWSQRP